MQTIKLSVEERSLLRIHVARAMNAPIVVTESLFQRGVHHGLRVALSSFLFVTFVLGSISAVASNALPGDPLYPVKVNFNAKVRAAFLTTPEEKVAFHKGQVEDRAKEMQTLAETKSLTPEKQKIAQKALDSNIKDLTKELGALSDQSPSTALSVTANLEDNLKENKDAIQQTIGTDDTTTEHDNAATAAVQAVDGTIQKVSQQEVKILSKEIDNITDEATTTDTTPTTDSTGDNTTDDTEQNASSDQSTTTTDDDSAFSITPDVPSSPTTTPAGP